MELGLRATCKRADRHPGHLEPAHGLWQKGNPEPRGDEAQDGLRVDGLLGEVRRCPERFEQGHDPRDEPRHEPVGEQDERLAFELLGPDLAGRGERVPLGDDGDEVLAREQLESQAGAILRMAE